MERVQFIQYKGKVILSINLAGCSAAEVHPVIDAAKAAVATRRAGTVLTLTDVTGTGFDSVVASAMKDLVRHHRPYVAAAAVVGLSGLRQIMFNTVMRFSGRHLHAFESLQQAKDWLARQ